MSYPKTLAVKLTIKGENAVRQKHPWIFSESIVKINKEGQAGDIAIIFSKNNNAVIGVGLYDPFSPIKIKMIHFGEGAILNTSFFSNKIKKAHAIRSPLIANTNNSYRLLYGENDGFPSLIVDVYAQVAVFKLYSLIWLPFLTNIVQIVKEITHTSVGVLRLSRNCSKQNTKLKEGDLLYGNLINEEVDFLEHGLTFRANVIKGHKTGYFLDHRHNRKRVGELSKEKSVLDVFAYAGGFSVHALAGGANEVTSLDISAQAIEIAKKNAQLNHFKGKHKVIIGDAFTILENLITQNITYDLVVIDPPSFAKSSKEISIAEKKYAQLAKLGASLVKPKGILVLASCSSRVKAEDFFKINHQSLQKTARKFKLLESTAHDIDHPIHFPEGAYLKCGYYQFIN